MLDIFLARLKQGHRTIKYPAEAPTLPDRFRGRPVFDTAKCSMECQACAEACPTGAIEKNPAGKLSLDLGRCLFCTDCVDACAHDAVRHAGDYKLAVRSRADLKVAAEEETVRLAAALDQEARRIFGHSLKLRQVSAGGCNACEADTNVLGTVGFDLGRFGIQFVASPRHADGILVTGPVPENMRIGLLKTWEAIPAPKICIAVGACAISGGPFRGNGEIHNGADGLVPVDLYIPGCPPHPMTILDGLLRVLGQIK